MSETATAIAKPAEMECELKAMKRLQKELAELTPAQLRRVGPWVANVASEMADAKEAAEGEAD